MEGYTKEELVDVVLTYLNNNRRYTYSHKYQSGCDGKERLIIEEV
jgi:hypothetical protein